MADSRTKNWHSSQDCEYVVHQRPQTPKAGTKERHSDEHRPSQAQGRLRNSSGAWAYRRRSSRHGHGCQRRQRNVCKPAQHDGQRLVLSCSACCTTSGQHVRQRASAQLSGIRRAAVFRAFRSLDALPATAASVAPVSYSTASSRRRDFADHAIIVTW
jgi:hypothetical protein